MAAAIVMKQAQVEDAREILDLQKLAYQSEAEIYHDDTIPPLTQTLEEITADFRNQVFIKASVDGRIVGSVRGQLKQETCSIGRLIVHPDFQNQGIGIRLMDEVEKYFPEAGRFELFTGHRSERNKYLYRKLGYQVFRRQPVNSDLTLLYLEKRR
jgi:ribosomal protein S18 acetylase RimI-like enzyme